MSAIIQGDLVRAHISTSGDPGHAGQELMHRAFFASNTTGNIFFDGRNLFSGGTYEFKSGKGDITLPSFLPTVAFHLVGDGAPSKKISLGRFWNVRHGKLLGERTQSLIGDVGDGGASVTGPRLIRATFKFVPR